MRITKNEIAAAKRAVEKMKLRAAAEKAATKIEETTGEPCSCEQVLKTWAKQGRTQ